MSLPIVLGLVKTLVGLFIKDTQLAAIVNQIIEAILGFIKV
jgi:ascorbate-specific PTS system EIIC-type component UlaA